MKKWEYLHAQFSTEKGELPISDERLDEFGQKGWEIAGYSANVLKDGSTWHHILFKRPVEEERPGDVH